MNNENKKEQNSISINFLINNEDFNLNLDIDNKNNETYKSFAMFLILLQNGGLYIQVLKKIQSLIENNASLDKKMEEVLKHKNLLESSFDKPVILPSQVFSRNSDD